MNIQIPGIYFLQSSIPLEFTTDNQVKKITPATDGNDELDSTFILNELQMQLFNIRDHKEIFFSATLSLPDDLHFPVLFDGTKNLSNKKILFLMLTGFGDTILIEPVVRAFHQKFFSNSEHPGISIAGNWIASFPYSRAPYISKVHSNILSLKELMAYDVLVNFIPTHFIKSATTSIQESYANVLQISIKKEDTVPVIYPDKARQEKLRPLFDQIRTKTGKKLLYVNWLARFPHKNAPVHLFDEIINLLPDYQVVTFNENSNSQIINEECTRMKASLINLSEHISDYHDTIAALSLVDAFISVDTGVVHAAGALKIPGIALFGPFPPETHIFCYPTIIGMRSNSTGEKCQEPCLETHRGCRAIDYKSGISPCFQTFSAKDILAAFNEIDSRNIKNILSGENNCAS